VSYILVIVVTVLFYCYYFPSNLHKSDLQLNGPTAAIRVPGGIYSPETKYSLLHTIQDLEVLLETFC
jgi:hypothetical protein